MATANQLTALRAVSAGYPLRGKVMISDEPFGPPELARGIPGRGEVWPESRLAAALGASIGSELAIGASKFRVSRILIRRPDQGATFVELAPSLLMNDADLAATQLIQPGSRMRRAQLFAGTRATSSPSRTGSRPTRRNPRSCSTSTRRRRRSRTRSIGPGAS